MDRRRSIGLVLGIVGLVDSLYLTAESLSSQIPLYCPSVGIVNCVTLTESSYSRFGGVPVALLGAIWFAVVLVVLVLNRPGLDYSLIPLWAVAMVFAGYLIFVELFVVHAICPYCTVAHVTGMALGIPAFKLALDD